MAQNPKHIILCNGATLPKGLKRKGDTVLELSNKDGKLEGGKILLEKFVLSLQHIPSRVKDLLELASLLFIADRTIDRGQPTAVEFDKWSRTIHFVMKVRDESFWNQHQTASLLSQALTFMTGDYEYQFYFQAGLSNTSFNLFDSAGISIDWKEPTKVALFSGGLDSFTGAIDFLETNKDTRLLLVSHKSGNPSTRSTQERVYKILEQNYPGRTTWYKFQCHMKGGRAREETQRTRSFLYSSVAYALSHICQSDELTFFENGITSLNFPKRSDMINARSSRTTHPRTIWHLSNFFTHFHGRPFKIQHPYLLLTKTDVIAKLREYKKAEYINSTVSCSATFKKEGNFTHCGTCSQCVDRRFAMHASHLDAEDGLGIYTKNFITENIDEPGDRLTVLDHVIQAMKFKNATDDSFYDDMANELLDILEYLDTDEEAAFKEIFQLCKRHGSQIHSAIIRMRTIYDDPFEKIIKGSFLDFISEKEYLKTDSQRLVEKICQKLADALPIIFQKNAPKDENDLNDKIHGILQGEAEGYGREFPSVSFAMAKTVLDHSFSSQNLLIETKYLRGATTPSKITDALSSDIIKYPADCPLMFVIYDPERMVKDEKEFINAFTIKREKLTIHLIR